MSLSNAIKGGDEAQTSEFQFQVLHSFLSYHAASPSFLFHTEQWTMSYPKMGCSLMKQDDMHESKLGSPQSCMQPSRESHPIHSIEYPAPAQKHGSFLPKLCVQRGMCFCSSWTHSQSTSIQPGQENLCLSPLCGDSIGSTQPEYSQKCTQEIIDRCGQGQKHRETVKRT
jgi:hypothetical protein